MKSYLPKIIGAMVNAASYISSQYAAKFAINLFSIPRKGEITPVQSEYLQTATQSNIIVENISLKVYHWKGHKETVLLAHGWESNTYRWKELVQQLRVKDYNIIAFDAPAHGASKGKYFNALLYADCIYAIANQYMANAIIGHSVGGMSAMFSQHKYKLKSIKKIVLLGAPADFIAIFNSYEKIMGYNKRVSEAIKNYILKYYNHLPTYFSASTFSKKIKPKGLIIHDKKDRIIPYTDALKFKKNYVNASFISTIGLGHRLKSTLVDNHILEFLETA